jgi:hypothetical protein
MHAKRSGTTAAANNGRTDEYANSCTGVANYIGTAADSRASARAALRNR